MLQPTVPSFPIYVTLPVCGATLILVLLQVWRLRDSCVAFLLLATWLRYSIAVFHEYTYPPVVLGFSAVALSSLVVVAVGLVVIRGRNLVLQKLSPIYAVILIILISGVINRTWIGAINATIKWLYLIVFAVAAYVAMRRRGSDQVLGSFAVVFVGPIGLQWLSVALGLKTTNEDGSSNFIGGYQHEQAFSIILLTFLYVTCFSRGISVTASYGRLAIAAAGLVLANYRTTLLAAALPAASLALSRLMGKLVPKQRGAAFVVLGVVTVFVFVGIANLAHDRFADIGAVLDRGASLIQPPEHFTMEEKRLFSGRAYLWSQYIDAYLRGNIINILFGFGPEAWVGRFPLYAHNTFISHLYELGIFGLVAFTWILISNFLAAVHTKGERKLVLLSCHVGFVILNLATMPIWTLEGAILYALLLGQTWYMRSRTAVRTETWHDDTRPRLSAYGYASEQQR